MPLHIDIRLNQQLLGTVHIGRVEGDEQPNTVNTYRAVETRPGDYDIDFFGADSVEFTHRYGDGALICAQKAIEALTKRQ